MTERVLRMVGNAHIDPVWLWQWPEGLAEVRATFRSALDRLAEYPDFVFTAGSAAHYEWVERTDPAMFEEIRARVAEGRWELVGGWWVEPDCNLPGGESFVRQALLGQRYFRSRFDRQASVGFNVDSFGHAATLPQLLRRAGLDHYVFMRPQPHELALPGEVFWWEAPDSSRVLAARLPHEYCGPRGALDGYLEAALAKLGDDWREAMLFYGVGNHGGGPTRANIDSLRSMDGMDGRPRLVLSSPGRFFAGVRGAIERGEVELPVWRGELQHHARGCYSAHSRVKRWDRTAERALLTAETLEATVALALEEEAAEDRAPARLEQAWRDVAFNQFHDVLAGTAIEPAYDDARDSYGEATAVAGRVTAAAFQRIARRIAIPLDPQMRPIVVLNPHPWPLRAVVELETGGVRDEDVLVDEEERPLPHQRIQSLATASDWRRRIAFAADLPPLGYRTYRLLSAERAAAALPATPGELRASDTVLENELLRAELDPATGWIASLRARTGRIAGLELAGEGLGRAIVLEDPSDTWSHDLVAYDRPLGAFRPVSVRLVEAGPVRATIRVDGRFGESRLVLDVSLAAGADRLDLRTTLDWRERRRVLKLRFGTALESASARSTAGIPYGAIERPADGGEEPGGTWMDVSGRMATHRGPGDGRAGLTVLTDGRAGLDARGSDLGLTLVRSPIFAHHDPRLADEAAELLAYQDQGLHRLHLVLLPHGGDWRAVEPARAAAELAQPPLTLLESFHDGELALRGSFGALEGRGVTGTLKRAEDGGATIVRLVETLGRPTRASVRLPGGRYTDLDLGPWEVRTLVVPDDPARPAVESDLLEGPLSDRGPVSGPPTRSRPA